MSEGRGSESPAWRAVYTRARAERAVEELLTRRGFESYVPRVTRVSQWVDRRKRVQFPIYPSYVFTRFEPEQSGEILRASGVVSIVRIENRPVEIRQEEIDNIRRFVEALEAGGPIEELQVQPMLTEGQRVRIVDGPFAGIFGIIVEVPSQRRVVVGLNGIGGFEVNVAAWSVEPV